MNEILMNHQITYLHCGENLKESLKDEIDEVLFVVGLVEWEAEVINLYSKS